MPRRTTQKTLVPTPEDAPMPRSEDVRTALIVIEPAPLVQYRAGQAANATAAQSVLATYRRARPANTIRRQDDDLAAFARYLVGVGVPADGSQLATEARSWAGVTWGLIAGFVEWQLREGYALGTVQVRLATVKRYATLATQAGALAAGELQLIKTVRGYTASDGRRIDEGRDVTRRSTKKAMAARITPDQVAALKEQPNTPQGRRDLLLLCLMLDHGLRVGEVAGLTVTVIDTRRGMLTFYRAKVDKEQTHRLSADTLRAAIAYMAGDALASGPLLRGSDNAGVLVGTMGDRAIRKRVRLLGAAVGMSNLSPHDMRHSWATRAARGGTDVLRLQDAGGWSSLEMPARYVEKAKIANEGVRFAEE